ncbi:MAG: UPF0149 family protein [Gammaproteobacteria bacterium]|nr:UPF0149 family protein [Gammaproteobacteria bacterium]MDH5630811.1 UPF0149 family protein [Gammaproteobacteria bacterium]
MLIFDVKALEHDFQHANVKESFNNLYHCLGFITAIASSPAQIKPSEWIKQLMLNEDKSPQFDNDAQAKKFSLNLIAWWKLCLNTFDKGDTISLPETIALNDLNQPNQALFDYGIGYLKGYKWLSSIWQKKLPQSIPEAENSLIMLNLILARFVNEDEVAKNEPELYQQLPDMVSCFKSLPPLISAVGMLGKDLSEMENPVSEIVVPEFKKKTKLVGRNDPCMCGSGKKFKKCCLH